MQLNDKGQCPVCLRKPLTYKRENKKWCSCCGRSFNYNTGEFVPSNFWIAPNIPSEHHLFYGEPVWEKPVYWTNHLEPDLKLPTAVFYRLKKEKHIELIDKTMPVGSVGQNKQYEKWMGCWQHHEV